MTYETTQPSLLQRVRDLGDHDAWREFDHKYRTLILRYCRRRGLQLSDAEDVRQMVMLNLARQVHNFEYRPDRGRFRSYLGQVVSNAIHRYFRRPKLGESGLDTHVAEDLSAEPAVELDELWEQEWMLHHYRQAMRSVREHADPKSVRVFEHLLTGQGVDEVAETFGMTRDAVHKVKQRIRDRLRDEISRQVFEEEGGDA